MKGEDELEKTGPLQLPEIMLDGVGDEAIHDPLELDEENLRVSIKSENLAKRKTQKLDLVAKTDI